MFKNVFNEQFPAWAFYNLTYCTLKPDSSQYHSDHSSSVLLEFKHIDFDLELYTTVLT